GGQASSAADGAPARPRTSRLGQARVWHPRGRTIGDQVQAGQRPALRLVEGGADADRTDSAARSRAGSATASRTGSATASRKSRTGSAAASRKSRTGTTVRRATGAGDRPAAPRPRPAPPKLANSGARLRQATALILALFVVLGVRLVVFQFTDAPTYA